MINRDGRGKTVIHHHPRASDVRKRIKVAVGGRAGEGGGAIKTECRDKAAAAVTEADLTRRWALRESLPPTEVTLQVYVPMSPDHVWEMCKVPSASWRRRGAAVTSMGTPPFSHTCLRREGAARKLDAQQLCFHEQKILITHLNIAIAAFCR